MSALDKFYDFTLNLPDAKLTSKTMSLCNIDRNVFNIYLTLQEGKNNPVLNSDLSNYTVTMIVVKPKTKEYVEKVGVIDGSNDRLLFELGETFNDQIGSYKGEIKVQNGDEVITSSSFAYTVTQSLISGLNAEIEANPDVEILRQLINEVKAAVGMTPEDPDSLLTDYQKKTDETLTTTEKEIPKAINEVNSQIKDVANEIIQARGKYALLKDRFKNNESQLEQIVLKNETQDNRLNIVENNLGIGIEQYSDVYGIEIDIPNNKFTRLAGAIGKNAGTDFDGVSIFGNRKRCIVADDTTILAFYGEDGYIETGKLEVEIIKNDITYHIGTPVQVMVQQPKFYYKRVPIKVEPIQNGIGYHLRHWYDYISPYPKPGFKLHPNFLRNGIEYDYILLPAYEGSIYDVSENKQLLNDEQICDFTTDKLCSIANSKPCSGKTQDLTIVNSRKIANNRGQGWQLLDVTSSYADIMLMSIEYASFDFQTVIGQGVVSMSDTPNTENNSILTGGTSHLGNASGMAEGINGQVSVSYRGRENPWGNMWKWIDGLNIECKGIHQAYWANSNFKSDTKDSYKNCGFTLAKSNGYISAVGYSPENDFMYIPTETLGASNRPLNDYYYQNNTFDGFLVARLGGNWRIGSNAGACCLNVYYGSGYRDRNFGAGLLCIPKTK